MPLTSTTEKNMKFKFYKYRAVARDHLGHPYEYSQLEPVGFIAYDTEEKAWEEIYKYGDDACDYLVLRRPFYGE